MSFSKPEPSSDKPQLDSGLWRLSTTSLDTLPFPVQTFCTWHNQKSPVAAMEKVVEDLLVNCGQKSETGFDCSTFATNIGEICRFLGIDVRGPQPSVPSKSVYSTSGSRGDKISKPAVSGTLQLVDGKPVVYVPNKTDLPHRRLSVAHEIGHYLMLWKGDRVDRSAAGFSSTQEEEELAEYAARLILLPKFALAVPSGFGVAKSCIYLAGRRCTTVWSAARRMGDPGIAQNNLRAIVLWRLNPEVLACEPLHKRMTPQWFIGEKIYIPVKKCHAGFSSLVANLAAKESGEKPVEGVAEEMVSIGSLKSFNNKMSVDAFAWGSVSRGTRLVLSVFFE